MKAEEQNKVIYTGSIPQCPHCEKPTTRIPKDSYTTCMYYPPVYDENGNNTNPDRNTTTTDYSCLDCQNEYTVSRNIDGSFYVIPQVRQ